MTFNTATPYIASYVLLSRNGKYAFVKRANTGWRDGYYGLPAGKVEHAESYLQAAVREAKEEVGVDIKQEDLQFRVVGHRQSEKDIYWVDVIFETNVWTGDVVNAEPDVHSEVAWFALTDLPDNVVPELRILLDAVVADQQYVETGWNA